MTVERCDWRGDTFVNIVTKSGMPKSKIKTVKGFYDDSLTPELAASLLPRKAAVIYVDCDLYKSTIPVLKFIVPFLQKGTVIVFDDWNCFYGDPAKGERKAWGEFLAENPRLVFEKFVSTNEAQSFVCIKP
jgi:O-methyltransferase